MVLFTLTLEITQDTSTPDEGYYGFRLTEIPLTKSFASHSILILTAELTDQHEKNHARIPGNGVLILFIILLT